MEMHTFQTVYSKIEELPDAVKQLTARIVTDTENQPINRKLQKHAIHLQNKDKQIADHLKTISH